MIRDITESRMIFAEPTAAFVREGRVYGFIPATPTQAVVPRSAAVSAWAKALQEFSSKHEGSDTQ